MKKKRVSSHTRISVNSMGVCPLNRLTTTVVDYKDEDEREADLYML